MILWGIICLIIVSWLVGKYAERKRIGFYWTFLISLFLSPFIGLIVALLSRDKESEIYTEDRSQPWKIYNDKRETNHKPWGG